MNKIYTILLILVNIILFQGCTNQDFPENTSSLLPDGKIRLKLTYDLPLISQITSKSGYVNRENLIDNAVLLVFEAHEGEDQKDSDCLLQIVKAEISSGNIQPDIHFIVAGYNRSCRIKVLANLDDQTMNTVLNYKTKGNSSNPVSIGVFKELSMSSQLLNNPGLLPFLPLCSAENTIFNGIDAQTNISVALQRIYAALEVHIDPSVSNFELHEIYLHNGYKNGRFEPYKPGEYPLKDQSDFSSFTKIADDAYYAGPLYLFENLDNYKPPVLATCLILKGVYKKDGNTTEGYYKVNVGYYKGEGASFDYDIHRNCRYKVNISQVSHYGEQTLENAINSYPENIPLEYEITFDDFSSSNDIIYHSSGYAISSTNSEAHVYAASSSEVYSVATLLFEKSEFYNLYPDRSLKVIGSDQIEIMNESEVLNIPIGNAVDLKVRFTKPEVSGAIEIRFGGLRKLINVRASRMLRSDSLQIIKIQGVLNAQYGDLSVDGPWCRISKDPNYPSDISANISFESPSTVYCLSPENRSRTRESVPLYFFMGQGRGTLKLIVTQTYGSSAINDLYYRETFNKSDKIHTSKRANCFLLPVNESCSYHLTGSVIYDYYGLNAQISDPRSEIIWCDFNFKDPNPFEPHDLIEISNPDGNIEHIVLHVRNFHSVCGNNGNGNLVWGIKDASGEWLWSWHVWFTDMVCLNDQLASSDITYSGSSVSVLSDQSVLNNLFSVNNGPGGRFLKTKYNTVSRIYLDRNVGARLTGALSSLQITGDDARKHHGLYYQWGRKDPLPGIDKFNDMAEPFIYTPCYPNGIKYNLKSERTVTIRESIKEPLTFFAKGYSDWCNESGVTRWNSSNGTTSKGMKTIFDPSPFGWRVNWGNGNDLALITDKKWLNCSGYEGKGGLLIENKFWFAASGSRYYLTGNLAWSPSIGAYWVTGNVNDVSNSYCSYFMFQNGNLSSYSNYYIYRTYGCQIRPVLDT
ncbi:MAG: hypothetical protein ACRCX4_02525 [Bacteroidales bacterium]